MRSVLENFRALGFPNASFRFRAFMIDRPAWRSASSSAIMMVRFLPPFPRDDQLAVLREVVLNQSI